MEKDIEELTALFKQKSSSSPLVMRESKTVRKDELHVLKRNHQIMIALFAFITVVIYLIHEFNQQHMQTSTTGFMILMGCSIYYTLSKLYLFYRIRNIQTTDPTLQVVQALERYKRLNNFMHTYGEVMYVSVLSVGIYLYLKDILNKYLLDHTGKTLLCFWWIWGACFLWIVINTFVIKRKRMKKDLRILEGFIHSLEQEV